jgi:hypothetical protein
MAPSTAQNPFATPAVLRWRLAGSWLSLKLLRLRFAVKDGFNPNQPRVPAGQADGGRWTREEAKGHFASLKTRREDPAAAAG